MKKPTALTLIFSLSFFMLSVAIADHHKAINAKCPVSGEAVDADQAVTYTKAVGFCCGKCLGKFMKDPSAHAAKIAKVPAGKIVNSKSPMSGEPVDETATFALNGSKVAFCCNNCLGKFKADPAKHAKKVKYDTAANQNCIFSDEPVDSSKVTAYKVTVGFCCGKCKAKFEKDPDSLLGKVSVSK